jgi:hypothetical protein
MRAVSTPSEIAMRMGWHSPTARSYAVLLATMIVARIGMSLTGAVPMIASQAMAMWWATLAIMALLGWGALLVAARVGLAAEWERSGSARRWYVVAASVAVLYGIVSASGDIAGVVRDGGAHMREVWGTADPHQRFPASIFFYYYGALFIELMLRLIGLTLLTWLLRPVVGRSRPLVAFWIASVIVSLYEPSAYFLVALGTMPVAAWPSVLVSEHILDALFLANLFTCYLYQRHGIWIAVFFRYAYYLIWHVAYGSFRPFWLELFLG